MGGQTNSQPGNNKQPQATLKKNKKAQGQIIKEECDNFQADSFWKRKQMSEIHSGRYKLKSGEGG